MKLKLYDQTKKDKDTWKNLPLSLAGQINIIRMKVSVLVLLYSYLDI